MIKDPNLSLAANLQNVIFKKFYKLSLLPNVYFYHKVFVVVIIFTSMEILTITETTSIPSTGVSAKCDS